MKVFQKFLIVIIIIILSSCSYLGIYTLKTVTENIPEKYRKQVIETIESSGKNKKELKKVLYHYKDNPQKLEAASFLIANMQGHKYVEVGIFDSLDNQIVYDVLDYDNYHQIIDYLDSLEVEIGELHWDKVMEEKDIETVSSDYLIRHIDLAYDAYNTLSWAKNLGWKTFMEFVLPYRGSSEPISDWRTFFWEDFASFRDSTDDPIELATIINKKCREMFTFKDVYYLHPTDLGLEEMLETGLGRCEDMTNFTIYAMRANGLAVTSDYTPYWPNSSNNHAWNVLILSEDKAIPFMGAEADPGKYSIRKEVAKVYRKLFFEEDETLASKLNEDEKAPAWLSGKNYRDVTDQYTETTDVRIDSLNSEKRFAYLSIFNSNKWKAIHWAEIDSTGNAVFTKMGDNIIYLPMYFVESDTLKDKDDKP
ncbi:MAG: transglutaminase domain-containing protein, partial [Candidatus Cloacimonetes bacterium]|nr:transglutaminase domain-containing protein [Candidatus Cloacimonadota bacterium]